MLAYALSVGFIVAFIAIAGIGHLLVMMAVWPDLFGTPHGDVSDAARESQPRRGSQLPA